MLTVKTSSPNHWAILESLSTLLLTLTPGRGHVFIITVDCTTIQTNIDNVSTFIVLCYMDRLEKDCLPDAFKKVVNYAKKHNMALISGTDANAHNTNWNSRITDKAGT